MSAAISYETRSETAHPAAYRGVDNATALNRLNAMGLSTAGMSEAERVKALRWAAGLPKREIDRFPRVVSPIPVTASADDAETPGSLEGFRDRAYDAGLEHGHA